MPESAPQFTELEGLLQEAGINGDCSQRLIEELQDHYEDSVCAAVESGVSLQQAKARALLAIGAPGEIAAAAMQYRDLLSVSKRYPLIAGIAHGVACVVSAPALPVIYCAQRRESITRWGVSAGLAAMLTAGLLLSMQTMLGAI